MKNMMNMIIENNIFIILLKIIKDILLLKKIFYILTFLILFLSLRF